MPVPAGPLSPVFTGLAYFMIMGYLLRMTVYRIWAPGRPNLAIISPTAITLASLTARSGNVYAVPLLVGSLLLLAALLLVVRRVRSRVN